MEAFRNRDGLPVAQRVRHWKVSRMILVQSFSNRISMAQHLQSSITICQRKHPQIVDFEAVSRHLFFQFGETFPWNFLNTTRWFFEAKNAKKIVLVGDPKQPLG